MSNKAEESSLVPKRRFPEFLDSGEWQSIQLEDLISTVTPPKKIQTSDYLSEGSFPIIDQGQSDIAGWTNDPDAIVEVSHPLIVFGDHTCVLKLIRQSFAQGADGIKIIKGSGLADTAFLYQFLCFQPVVTEEYKRHFSILKTKVVAYPDRKSGEQQKIANCLASLDELITLEAQKLDTLKTHKKGLMQQLFPAEGETLPKRRFPEFRDTGEWESKPIAKVCYVLQGYGFPEVLQGKSKGKYPFCKVSDVSRAVAENGGLLAEATNYVGDDELLKLKAKLIPKGATVFAKIGEALRLNRRAYVQNVCLIDNNVTGLKAINGVADDYFVYLLSQLIDLNKHCGGAVPSVNKSTLEGIEVVVPGPDEQKQIADSLASLDDLITAQTRKLTALKTHRKGLMQQLFPALDEVPA